MPRLPARSKNVRLPLQPGMKSVVSWVLDVPLNPLSVEGRTIPAIGGILARYAFVCCLVLTGCGRGDVEPELSNVPKDTRIAAVKLGPDEPVDFNFHVKPILSDRCFACHGPDEGKRESGLRLDVAEGAVANLAEGDEPARFGVVPGELDRSEVWRRISSHDSEMRMPPAEAVQKPLTDEEQSILRRWIEQGADYKPHWSFIPPVKPELPAVKGEDWPENPIDRFVLAKIEQLGIEPSPKADKATLIRRVSLDLTGLPPLPEEVDAFVQDESPDAYAKVVERLLASPHFGERVALDWLDVARYADTNAHHVDYERTSWPWRDWVIQAFNENKPYDEFIIEQLAGDLLPEPTLEQRIATSFNRHHPITNEAGAIAAEYLIEYAADRVATTSTAFLGLTMACSRCHDHKFDPLSQDDYFSMMAYFNSIDEKGLEAQNARKAEAYEPNLNLWPNEEDKARFRELQDEMKAIAPHLKSEEAAEALKEIESQYPVKWELLKPAEMAFWNGEERKGPNHKHGDLRLNSAEGKGFEFIDGGGEMAFDFPLEEVGAGHNVLRLHFSELNFERLERRLSQYSPLDSETQEIEVRLVEGATPETETVGEPLRLKHVWAEDRDRGEESFAAAFDQKPASVWRLKASNRMMSLFMVLEEELPVGTEGTRLRLSFKIPEGALPPISQNAAKLYAASIPQEPEELLAALAPFSWTALIPVKERHYQQTQSLILLWSQANGHVAPGTSDHRYETMDRLYLAEREVPRIMVMQESKEPRETYVLDRGAYDAPLKDRLRQREVPAVFGAIDAAYPRNRLGLAKWLVQRDNPLTSRVTVNRYWQLIFGIGLVKTSEDFGAQGELPSHPELLDYLATDFMESGWDVKSLFRKMVTSSTYQQASNYRPELELADPENRLLSYFPRMRLQSEFIRDNALAASGLLNPEIGGKSVKPYQPDGLWRERTMRSFISTGTFERDTGGKLYRRGMYTFWKQVAPPPQMEVFDAPARDVCVIRRNVTNTPMQALTLQNDETYLEISRVLAARLMHEVNGDWSETLDERLVLGFRYLTGRRPSEADLGVLRDFAAENFMRFSETPEDAGGFLGYGESELPDDLPQPELAALAFTASAMLNLDKTITRD